MTISRYLLLVYVVVSGSLWYWSIHFD